MAATLAALPLEESRSPWRRLLRVEPRVLGEVSCGSLGDGLLRLLRRRRGVELSLELSGGSEAPVAVTFLVGQPDGKWTHFACEIRRNRFVATVPEELLVEVFAGRRDMYLRLSCRRPGGEIAEQVRNLTIRGEGRCSLASR